MDEKRKSEGIAVARREIARRIARFCTSLSPEELDALLDRMAFVQWKYDVMPLISEPLISEPQGVERQLRELLE